jgi:glycosyltransferase involved in cell wall biosynthesis
MTDLGVTTRTECPTVSVIIPTFQCAPYLQQCLDSVLGQTYPTDRIEIIVVDDGSTDETPQVAAAYTGRIRYLRQPNRGVSAARNAGIAAAEGHLLAFLDADDYWLPRRLELMVPRFAHADKTLVTTDFYVQEGDRVDARSFFVQRPQYRETLSDPAKTYTCILEDNFLPYMMMLPRLAIEEVGNFDTGLRYGEDWDLWLRCLRAGYRVELVDEPCAVYRHLRPGATTTQGTWAKARDRVTVLSRHRRYVSRRRWALATGVMHHLAVRELVAQRRYLGAAIHLGALAPNITYVREWVKAKTGL